MEYVNRKQFHNIDFDRQRIVGNYIIDFYLKALGLVIEIDGSSHNDKEEYDLRREYFLKSLGLKIFKISDLRVKNELDNVFKEMEDFIIDNFQFKGLAFVNRLKLTTPPFRLPSRGGEF